MSTLVQIKRSSSNVSPTTLLEGELAYSFLSNTLFIGTSSGAAINIGGQYYATLIDQATAANSSSTIVRRYANGSSQFSQLDILVYPTANTHVATKQYVDNAIAGDVSLSALSDVNIGPYLSNQDAKILVGNAAGYYVGTTVTGNVSVNNTGVFTIGNAQVNNSMLLNSNVSIVAGAGLVGGGAVNLGNSITIDVNAGDGISNTSDQVSVDSTVVRTDRNQTVNGVITFANNVNITGNIYLQGNTTYVNVATVTVEDSLIYLAANNNLTDIVDIGFVGGKNTAGIYSHTGLIRHAQNGVWYLFDGLTEEVPQSNVVDIANTHYALLRANLETQQLEVTGAGSYANINTILNVTGNATLQSNLTVAQFSQANSFVSTKTVLSPPSLVSFDGERLRLYDFQQIGQPNYAIGVEPSNIWMGVDTESYSQGFKWYGNTTQVMRLSGNGVLEVSNTISTLNLNTSNISTDNLVVNQTANIATLNVSSSAWLASLNLSTPLSTSSGGTGLTLPFTANGVLYSNSANSLLFASGSEGNVLQIISGVPTFDMLDGGSF